PYFSRDFKGIINIVSNLPEGLAHYAATVLKLADPRQITAHLPLDVIRYEAQIRSQIVEQGIMDGKEINRLDLMVSGYHDLPWPLVRGSRLIRNVEIVGSAGQVESLEDDIADFIRNITSQQALASFLTNRGYSHARLHKMEVQQLKARQGNQGLVNFANCPTAYVTGKAIMEFASAFINRAKTTAAIPFRFPDYDRWFFVDLPVTFKNGYPVLDEDAFEARLEGSDYDQIRKRIIGDSRFSFQLKGDDARHEKFALEKVINDAFGEDCLFEVSDPNDFEALDGIFNSTSASSSAPHISSPSSASGIKVQGRAVNPAKGEFQIPGSNLAYKRLYYVKTTEPLNIYSVDLSSSHRRTAVYKVRINNDGKYDSRVRIRKIIEAGSLLFAECMYDNKKGERRSHWAWFNIDEASAVLHVMPSGHKCFDTKDNSGVLLLSDFAFKDTVALHGGNIYFLLEDQTKHARARWFNPRNPEENGTTGRGVKEDYAMIGLASLDDCVIFASDGGFYKAVNPVESESKLRFVSKSKCNPLNIRVLLHQGIVVYFNLDENIAYGFRPDSSGEHVQLQAGMDVQLHYDSSLRDQISFFSVLKNNVSKATYQDTEGLMSSSYSDITMSPIIPGLERVLIVNNDYIAGLAQQGNDTAVYLLDFNTLCPKETFILPDVIAAKCELSKK
ncbi:MAG: hypothetical protein ACMXX5_02225, partial [Candidatus Woesearchaeota archaeon]